MRLQRKPVNSLNIEMLTDLIIAIEKIENDKMSNGLVITSVSSMVFSKNYMFFIFLYLKQDK